MTVNEFYSLDEQEQAEAIWDGNHLGQRHDEDHNILLYFIKGIYVEVFYHREHNIIRKLVAYSSTDELLPFLGDYNNL